MADGLRHEVCVVCAMRHDVEGGRNRTGLDG